MIEPTAVQEVQRRVLTALDLQQLFQPLEGSPLKGFKHLDHIYRWGELQAQNPSHVSTSVGELHYFWSEDLSENDRQNCISELSLAYELWYQYQQQRKQNLQQRQELAEALATLRRTQEQLVQSEKTASLTSLVTGVAHELNTPLGIGLTASSSLSSSVQELHNSMNAGQLSQEQFNEHCQDLQDYAQLLERQIQRAAELVERFKRISVDQFAEVEREIELYNYLHDILASLGSEFKRHQIDVQLQCSETLLYNTYPGALTQILTQLLLNSLHHAFDENDVGACIRIQVEQVEQQADQGIGALLSLMDERIEVGEGAALDSTDKKRENSNKPAVLKLLSIKYSDNGQGVQTSLQHKLFDPFSTRLKSKFTGLGLYIAQNLVTQKLGGQIRYTPLQPGSAFEILLPLNE